MEWPLNVPVEPLSEFILGLSRMRDEKLQRCRGQRRKVKTTHLCSSAPQPLCNHQLNTFSKSRI